VSSTCGTNGIVCRQWCVHVVHVALCTCGVVYMSCMWHCVHVVQVVGVHVVLCRCHAGGDVYGL